MSLIKKMPNKQYIDIIETEGLVSEHSLLGTERIQLVLTKS